MSSPAAEDPAPLPELRFRQVHLDFHTSPLIPDVGADFNARDFAQTLKESWIDSINIFAKGHHGMSYYPTQVGVMHPHLKFDLLGQMIEACHAPGNPHSRLPQHHVGYACSDDESAEGIFGETELTRRCLAEVLAEKVHRGDLPDWYARQIGKQILRDNALELFPQLHARILRQKADKGSD